MSPGLSLTFWAPSLDVLSEVWCVKVYWQREGLLWMPGRPAAPCLLASDFSSLCYSRLFQTDVKNVTDPKLKMRGIALCNALPYCWLLVILAWMCTLGFVTTWPQTNIHVKFHWSRALVIWCVTPVSTFDKKIIKFGLSVARFISHFLKQQAAKANGSLNSSKYKILLLTFCKKTGGNRVWGKWWVMRTVWGLLLAVGSSLTMWNYCWNL